MASREQMFLSFLHSPAVTLYSDAQRLEALRQIPQSREEAREAERKFPVGYYQRHAMSAEEIALAEESNRAQLAARRRYRRLTPRTPEEREAILAKLARRAARQDYLRTDPWAGIDVNPWRITEDERKRFGLGRFR